MRNNAPWSVLIYTLVLVVISLIMALVILGIAGVLSSNAEIQEITRKLWNNVLSKGNLSIKYSQIVNSNGSWFTDVLRCPTSVTMSGTVSISGTTPTISHEDGDFFCTADHSWNPYRIYFLSGGITETIAEFQGDTIDMSSGVPSENFSDGDNTRMTFSMASTVWSDGIDDDFNSDNYLISSTWSWLYPDLYVDDDADSRKLLYGYANPWVWFVNMMWANQSTNQYIEDNPNNTDTLTEKIGSMTSSGVALLDINQNNQMQLFVLDRDTYNHTKEIITTSSYSSADNLWGLWYLQENSGILSLSSTKTGNEFLFDFANHDYAMFIRNNSTGALLYTVRVETQTGTGVYINPIDDSDEVVLKALANDIIIDNEWRFLYDQFEVIGFK